MALKGVNLGGWLLMEGYILHGRNIPESGFKAAFMKVNGTRALAEFESLYRANFVREIDFKNIRAMGASLIRVPFNHKLVENNGGKGLTHLDDVMRWAGKYGLKVILDLHAAPGAQNHDWHGDSDGRALLWEKASFRGRTYAIWEKVADRYRDHPALYGYDVLNEPVLDEKRVPLLKDLYRNLIRRIKAVDKKHLIFLEGNTWAQQVDSLADLLEDNVTVSIHYYTPLAFTFNFRPFYVFPGKVEGEKWDGGTIRRSLERYRRFADKNGVRIFAGEFGVNWRGGFFGETRWLESLLSAFDDLDFDYTYWTYKAVANSAYPDGIYQYLPNSPWVRRDGPVYGFENYPSLWKNDKREIAASWRTENYTANKEIVKTLKKHFKK